MFISIAFLIVGTPSVERGFNIVKIVKSPFRNRLSQRTLDALVRIKLLASDMDQFPFRECVEFWYNKRNRRVSVNSSASSLTRAARGLEYSRPGFRSWNKH